MPRPYGTLYGGVTDGNGSENRIEVLRTLRRPLASPRGQPRSLLRHVRAGDAFRRSAGEEVVSIGALGPRHATARGCGVRLSDWRELEGVEGYLSQCRVRAVSLLRKYFKMSVELGRLPSLLGREFFRAQVTSYTTHTFEDAVIFVHDMERALESLDPLSQLVISRVVFQEYSYREAARLLRISDRTFVRAMARAIDRLSEIMLERELMEQVHAPMSLAEVSRLKRAEHSPKKVRVSLNFLLSLRNPTFCQARRISKSRVSG